MTSSSTLTDANFAHNLAIVIVSWNVRELLRNNLEALKESDVFEQVQVIVVDNVSMDGTQEMIKTAFPWVTLIENEENLGFANGCNQGIAQANAHHILLLNPDMRLPRETLGKALAYLEEHPEPCVFSGLIRTETGEISPSVRPFPTLFDQLVTVTKLAKPFPSLVAHYQGRDLDLTKEQAADSLRGGFLFINEHALRLLGGLDQRYFIWFEEVDYCRRAKLMGIPVRHIPSFEAVDFMGRSFVQRRLFWKQREMSRAMIRYFETWHPWWQALLLRIVWAPVLTLAWMHDAFLSSRRV